jgi:hypothetical protein
MEYKDFMEQILIYSNEFALHILSELVSEGIVDEEIRQKFIKADSENDLLETQELSILIRELLVEKGFELIQAKVFKAVLMKNGELYREFTHEVGQELFDKMKDVVQ